MKGLSSRKADKEGRIADVIADALFHVTLGVRFRRRSESQEANVRKLLSSILDSTGQMSLAGFTVTGDRGYSKLSLVKELREMDIGSIFIMPNHLIRCHPFLARSYYSPFREDDEEENDDAIRFLVDQDNDEGLPIQRTTNADEATDQVEETVDLSGNNGTSISVFDRPKKFLIDDNPGASPFCVMSKLKRTGSSTAAAIEDVSAVAVREKGTAAHCKVLRFYYCVTPHIECAFQTFTTVPKNHSLSNQLFTKRRDDGSLLDPPAGSLAYRDISERHILSHCEVMTIAQRCADWFKLRKFRVTGNIAGQILMRDNVLRCRLGLQRCSNENLMTARID